MKQTGVHQQLVTLDLMPALAGRRFPEDFQIHVVIARCRSAFSARTNGSAVEIDHSSDVSTAVTAWTSASAFRVLELRPVMGRSACNVGSFFDPLHERIPVVEHPVGVAPLDIRQL